MFSFRSSRTADVINRGFSGYNSRWCRVVIDRLIPCKNASQLAAVVISLGANDSWTPIPNCPHNQHVPLSEFENNMKAIVNHFLMAGVDCERVILCTPTPYDSIGWSQFKQGTQHQTKTNEQVAEYAQAIRTVASEMHVTLIDIHDAFLLWQPFEELFIDGLHFAKPGARLFYQTLQPTVDRLVKSFRKTDCLNLPLYRQLPHLFVQAKLLVDDDGEPAKNN